MKYFQFSLSILKQIDYISWCILDFVIIVDISTLQQLAGYCIDLNFPNIVLEISHEKGIIGFYEIFSVQFVHFAFFGSYVKA